MTDRPPAADPADTSGGYGTPPPPWTGPAPDRPTADPHTAPPGPYAAGGQPYAGGPGPYAAGNHPAYPGPPPFGGGPARMRLWPPARSEWRVALAVLAAFAVLGALLAPLWEQLAPRLAFRVDQPGRALPVVPEAEEYVAADGRFVLLTLAAGIVVALGCWLLRSSRGPLVLLALALGGLLGAVVTWRLGIRLGSGYRPEDLQVVGRTVYQPLTLRARAGLVVEPVAAVVVYLLGVGFSSRNDLGRDDDPRPAPGQYPGPQPLHGTQAAYGPQHAHGPLPGPGPEHATGPLLGDGARHDDGPPTGDGPRHAEGPPPGDGYR